MIKSQTGCINPQRPHIDAFPSLQQIKTKYITYHFILIFLFSIDVWRERDTIAQIRACWFFLLRTGACYP